MYGMYGDEEGTVGHLFACVTGQTKSNLSQEIGVTQIYDTTFNVFAKT